MVETYLGMKPTWRKSLRVFAQEQSTQLTNESSMASTHSYQSLDRPHVSEGVSESAESSSMTGTEGGRSLEMRLRNATPVDSDLLMLTAALSCTEFDC